MKFSYKLRAAIWVRGHLKSYFFDIRVLGQPNESI